MVAKLLACLFVLLPTVAFAQGPNVKNPYKIAFCWNQMENDGVTPAVGPFQFQATVDGLAKPLVTLPAPSGASGSGGCPAGSFPYVITGQVSTKGNHTITGAIVSPDGTGDPSAPPFAFKVIGNPPGSPTNLSVTQ